MKTVAERFWEKVDRRGPADCWEWQGSTRGVMGYGQFHLRGRCVQAHRVAYELGHRREPGEQLVRHRCDNPRCCNPAHLELGSYKDNVEDMISRGRRVANAPRGERHWARKVTGDAVREIRSSNSTLAALAAAYGVAPMTISDIRRGKTWRSV